MSLRSPGQLAEPVLEHRRGIPGRPRVSRSPVIPLFYTYSFPANCSHSDDSYVIEEDTDIKARVAAIAQEAAERRARAAGDVTMGDGTS